MLFRMDDIDLLAQTKLKLASAHAESGDSRSRFMRSVAQQSGVGYEWLMKFSAGRIGDPGVVRVQKLHDYLSKSDQ